MIDLGVESDGIESKLEQFNENCRLYKQSFPLTHPGLGIHISEENNIIECVEFTLSFVKWLSKRNNIDYCSYYCSYIDRDEVNFLPYMGKWFIRKQLIFNSSHDITLFLLRDSGIIYQYMSGNKHELRKHDFIESY